MTEASQSLLPPNATPQERAIEAAILRMTALQVPIRDAWSPTKCPAELLPWLAWAFGVDEWSPEWPEDAKRAAIRDSVDIHRKKGTVWAIKRILKNAGHGDARLQEGSGGRRYDGTETHDGSINYGKTGNWAEYQLKLNRPITRAEGARIRALLEATAPVRCSLVGLSFAGAPNFYDGTRRYDGTFNHGAV